jgi:hypothetical protein
MCHQFKEKKNSNDVIVRGTDFMIPSLQTTAPYSHVALKTISILPARLTGSFNKKTTSILPG